MTGLAIGLALIASFSYGTGSVVVRSAVRSHTAASVALWVQAVGLSVLLIGAAVVRPPVSLGALVWGAAAGSLVACGVLSFYTAMQNGPISLVAPVAATGVTVPVAGGLLLGEKVSGLALAGLALVVIGVMAIARSHGSGVSMSEADVHGGMTVLATPPGRSQVTPVHDNCKPASFTRPQLAAVVLSVVSAAAFGVFYLVLRQATAAASATTAAADPSSVDNYPFSAALLVAVAVQSGSLLVTFATATRHTIKCVLPSQQLITFTAAIGLLDVIGDLALTYAIALGPVSLVGPLGSLDPMVAVLLASIFFREPLSRRRAFGLAACAAGIALVAV
jgi:drug/metabolite transporter (DMT)-like permease